MNIHRSSASFSQECLTEDESIKRIDNGNKKTPQQSSFTSKKRKRKCETNGRNFLCQKCNQAYLSYPALYTHNRNKHSMIPITSKKRFFKSSMITKTKFKYSRSETKISIKNNIADVIQMYKETFDHYSLDPQSLFYKEDANVYKDSICNRLLNMHSMSQSLPIKDDEENDTYCCIGEAIASYMIMMTKMTNNNSMGKLLSMFCYLLKEYLNTFGWDYFTTMINCGIKESSEIVLMERGVEYTECFTCEDLPDLMNDFVSFFLFVDSEVAKYQLELMDVSHNFCLWLYSAKMSNFYVVRVKQECKSEEEEE